MYNHHESLYLWYIARKTPQGILPARQSLNSFFRRLLILCWNALPNFASGHHSNIDSLPIFRPGYDNDSSSHCIRYARSRLFFLPRKTLERFFYSRRSVCVVPDNVRRAPGCARPRFPVRSRPSTGRRRPVRRLRPVVRLPRDDSGRTGQRYRYYRDRGCGPRRRAGRLRLRRRPRRALGTLEGSRPAVGRTGRVRQRSIRVLGPLGPFDHRRFRRGSHVAAAVRPVALAKTPLNPRRPV